MIAYIGSIERNIRGKSEHHIYVMYMFRSHDTGHFMRKILGNSQAKWDNS